MSRTSRTLLMLLVGIVATFAVAAPAGAQTFESEVDLSPFRRLAVHTDGRVKSLDTFASQMMRWVTGPRHLDEQSHLFTYFDLMLRPDGYMNRACIFVKKKVIRAQISRTLNGVVADLAETDSFRLSVESAMRDFMETGLIAPRYLVTTEVRELLSRLSADILTTAKPVDEINGALNVRNPALLRSRLHVVPPPSGAENDPWLTLDELGDPSVPMAALVDGATRAKLSQDWQMFKSAWEAGDAAGVNAAALALADTLPTVCGEDAEIYPAAKRLELESWYFRSKNMTWIWVVYLLSAVPLLLHVIFRWEGARWMGLAMFLIAFGLHTAALLIRWYVSGRWPNSNMFEAVTTAAWMGGAFAFLFEIFGRRTPMRGLVALGSTAASAVALMCAYYMPISLDAHISNRMPVLHDLWLYIHTNVIIFSYCLIFMAAVSGGLYLGYRFLRRIAGTSAGPGGEFARVGGAGSLIAAGPDGTSYLDRPKTTLGQVLDGTTMVLMELSFVLLWAGIVMGAIWADHSWGRPWGWDPKEVFALNTFIVFAVLIHTRFKVRDKGLWTAVIAIVGCIVMLFNWIVINFTIAGLHSYA